MPLTYDPTTSRGKVRQLLADTTEPTWATDAEVDEWLADAADVSLTGRGAVHYAAHLGWLMRAARQATSEQAVSVEGRSVSYDVQSCERLASMHLRLSGYNAAAAMPTITPSFSAREMDQGWEDT